MKIKIIGVGKLKEKYLVEGVEEYLKRLRKLARVQVCQVPECRTIEEEGRKILTLVPAQSWLCVLDVKGEELSSEDLARKISTLALSGISDLTFAIGGTYGISEQVRQAASLRLSLSKMTFTHQMTRLLLAEQIYRAFKINRNEPYHW